MIRKSEVARVVQPDERGGGVSLEKSNSSVPIVDGVLKVDCCYFHVTY